MNIVEKRLDEIRPYERNPRRNDAAVEYVAESIKQFGFKILDPAYHLAVPEIPFSEIASRGAGMYKGEKR